MASFGSDVMRRSIELAIQATGTQALDDVAAKIKYNSDVIQVLSEQYKQNVISGEQYRASVAGLLTENDKLQASLDAIAASSAAAAAAQAKAAESLANQKELFQRLNSKGLNDEQAKSLQALTESIKDGAKFTDDFVQKFNRMGGGMDAAQQKSKNLAMGLMALAHAGQDAQYGFGAVVNNIPQIAYAMANAIPAMEKYAMQFSAIAMIGGTLINVAMPKIVEFASALGREMGLATDPIRTAAVTTDQLKAKLEALQGKTYKVDVDYMLIDRAEKRMKELESRLKTAEQMAQARTSVQEESGKAFKDTVVEGGGEPAMERALADALGRQGFFNTEGLKKARDAEAELAQIRDRMSRGVNGQEAVMLANRRASLESQIPGLRQAAKAEIDTLVKEMIGAAGQGDRNALRDIAGAFTFAPESFAMAGMDKQKVALGLMAADPENIKAQRESNKFAEQQAKDAKRAKKIDDDQIEDLNKQAKEHDAAIKPIVDGIKKRKDELTQAWAADEQKVANNLQQGIEKAARDAARGDKADARAIGQMIRNEAANDKARAREQAKAMREQAKVDKVLAAEELSQRFGDFAPDFAAHGGRLLRDRLNRGQPEQAAFNAVYTELLKTAANQEKQTGMIGEATQRLMMLEQHNRMINARLNQIQGQMGRGRNKKQTLLPHPAQR